jgi:hypothetical protein
VGERSTRWLSTRWAGLISDQWCVPTRTNRDYRSLSHGHTYTNGVRPYQTSSNGGGRALLGAPVKRFAGRRFVPPRHLCLAKTKWRRSQEQPHEALSAAVRANTRSRVRRLFSETGTLSLPSRRIVATHTLQRAAAPTPVLWALSAASSVGQLALFCPSSILAPLRRPPS